MTKDNNNLPRTVDEAVDRLLSELSFKDKTKIANILREELAILHFSLGLRIREKFGLWVGNEELLTSCHSVSREDILHADDASFVIVEALWERLQATDVLRVIK